MIKNIINLFVLTIISTIVNAQTVVTVVDGALSDYDHVFNEYYNYSHVQYIYDKSMIGQSGTITDIQFEHSNNICTTNSIRIYLGNSTKTSFTGGTDWINSGLTLVYTGSVTPANGWYNIDITDFSYDNTYNLIIVIDNDDGSYCGTSSFKHFYAAQASYVMLRDHASSDVGDYGSMSSFGSRQQELASLNLIFLNTTPCSGTPAGGTTQATVTSACAVYASTLTVTGGSTEANITFQWQSSSDGSVWNDIAGATTLSYIASVSATTYYRRVTTCTNSGLFSNSTPLQLIADCFIMSTGTVTTCSGHFYDSGGPSANYSNSENYVMTFCSDNPGEHIRFDFSSFYTEDNIGTTFYDYLEVYDGNSTAATLIFKLAGQASGSDLPPIIISTDSCITFKFVSDASGIYSGWDASISCTPDANNVPSDFCSGATHICNLNGYTGKTSSFYNKDFPGNMCDVDEPTPPPPCNLFLGNINNNSWITFTASATFASFDVTVSNCTQVTDPGIQLGVYSGTNCGNFVLLSNSFLTAGTAGDTTDGIPNNTTATVTVPYGGAPALVPGQTYYIMIDGQAGDVCDYSIVATSGVIGASIDITDTSICTGNSITLTASGGANYTWSTNPISTNSSVTVSPVSDTTYTVTITGGNPLCPDMAILSANIGVNPLPVATATPVSQSICSGGASTNIVLGADINGTTFTYTRNNPAGLTTTLPLSGSGIAIGGIIAGGNITNTTGSPIDIVYTITPVSTASCTGVSITATVTVNPIPTAAIESYSNPTACAGTDGSITATDDVLYSYTWNSTPQQNTAIASNLSSGNYIVTVSIGSCSIMLNQSLVDPGGIVVTISVNDSVICNGQSVTFTAGGITSGTYQFFINGVSQQGPGANSTFTSTTLTNGNIVNVVGVEAGCTGSSSSVVMSVSSIPSVTISSQTQEICSGSSSSDMILTATVSGTSFDWTRTNPVGITTSQVLSGTGLQNGESILGAVFINSINSPLMVTYTIAPTGPSPTYCTGNNETATITVNPTFSAPVNAVICQGQTYTLPDSAVVSTAGTYITTLQTTNGCDSIFVTTLTVNPVYNIPVDAAICQGQTYTLPDSTVVSAAGYYTAAFQTINGCDSIIVTNLTILQSSIVNLQSSICSGDSIFLSDAYQTASGIYNDTLQSTSGCDSIIVTQLTVNPVFVISSVVEICSGGNYIFNGHTYTTAGNYNDTLTTVNGCDSIIVTQLTVNPVFVISSVVEICSGGSYIFNGHTYTTAGNYYDTLTTVNGCDSVIVTVLTVNPLSVAPTGITPSQNPICSGTPVSLSVNGGSLGTGASWIWYNGNCGGSQINTGSSISVTPTSATTYFVRAEGTCNTTTCANVTITVNTNLPVSIFIAANDTAICSGTNVTFTATATNGGTPAYQWYLNGSPVGTNSAAYSNNNLSNNAVISCLLTSSEACATGNPATSSPIIMQVTPTVTPTVNISSNPTLPVCYGTSVTFHATTLYGGNNPTIQWFVNNNYVVSGTDFAPVNILNNDQVYCVLTSTLTCVSNNNIQSNTLLVMFNPLPVLSATQQAESCHGAGDASINLNITQGTPPYSIHWDNPSINATATAANLHSGTYNVTVTDNKSCSIDTSIFISPEGSGCLFIPNVFSPNSDGKNDVLLVRGSNIKSLLLRIYDRWGNKIFETDKQTEGWDGTYNGTPLNAGVFVYYMKAELQNGSIAEQQGNITLLK
ncbi:MAG: gliding motility-associated C-terminal domain-containing protein [Bacteroidia bacterium]|nr:gliding motility-associated C-terminal domain-containing protein [Bacteroidia bacterium]